jgi:hypothetical protein
MGDHWITLVISTKYNQVWYCDSSRLTDPITSDRLIRDWTDVMIALNEQVPDCTIIYINIRIFLFKTFNIYVVKVLRGHPKDKHRHLKHYTIFYVQQQALDNTCSFYVCLNMVAFIAQLNYGVSVFILLYC